MNFQENLKLYRKAAGYKTAKEFAEKLGIPYPSYMPYENRGREPKYSVLIEIARELHVSIDDLLGYKPTSAFIQLPTSYLQEIKKSLQNANTELQQALRKCDI